MNKSTVTPVIVTIVIVTEMRRPAESIALTKAIKTRMSQRSALTDTVTDTITLMVWIRATKFLWVGSIDDRMAVLTLIKLTLHS